MPTTSDEPTTPVFERVLAILDELPAIGKDQRNQQQNFMSLSDRVLQILGERFAVAVDLSGYPYVGTAGSNQWNIRVPDELHARIKAHATGGRSMAAIVLSAVAHEYDIPFSPQRRSPRSLGPSAVADLRRRNDAGESIRKLAAEVGVKRETLSRLIRAA